MERGRGRKGEREGKRYKGRDRGNESRRPGSSRVDELLDPAYPVLRRG